MLQSKTAFTVQYQDSIFKRVIIETPQLKRGTRAKRCAGAGISSGGNRKYRQQEDLNDWMKWQWCRLWNVKVTTSTTIWLNHRSSGKCPTSDVEDDSFILSLCDERAPLYIWTTITSKWGDYKYPCRAIQWRWFCCYYGPQPAANEYVGTWWRLWEGWHLYPEEDSNSQSTVNVVQQRFFSFYVHVYRGGWHFDKIMTCPPSFVTYIVSVIFWLFFFW